MRTDTQLPGAPSDLPDPRYVEEPDDNGTTPSERRRALLEAGPYDTTEERDRDCD